MNGPDFPPIKLDRRGRPTPRKLLPPGWMIAPELPILELREEQQAYVGAPFARAP